MEPRAGDTKPLTHGQGGPSPDGASLDQSHRTSPLPFRLTLIVRPWRKLTSYWCSQSVVEMEAG